MNTSQGSYDLTITVTCTRCGGHIYRGTYVNYQTKGGRWEKGYRITREMLGHHECPQYPAATQADRHVEEL